MRNRSELREIIMKVMYQVYILESTNTKYDVKDLIKEQLEVENEFVNDMVNGIIKNQKEISDLANKYLVDWNIERLSKVDKARFRYLNNALNEPFGLFDIALEYVENGNFRT